MLSSLDGIEGVLVVHCVWSTNVYNVDVGIVVNIVIGWIERWTL